MVASESTLAIPIWLAVAVLLAILTYAAWPEYARPRIVRWRHRRRTRARLARSIPVYDHDSHAWTLPEDEQ